MKQSPNDSKRYQTVTLENGLRVLLIQNTHSEKSAAALAVNVGHFNDPRDRQGLAHFLEHMLFLGTERYPDGSEYQKFIAQYGGNNNAWTSTEHTCFFFDIHHSHFTKAIDRFSQFFIAPLLSAEFVNKERQNIDAEFKLKLKDDIRRLYDVHKETINPKHPFSKFSVGNIDTLADRENRPVKDDVQSFFHRYYRAEFMTLALEGPQSLDELSTLASLKFADIPSAKEPLPQVTEPLYLPEHQGINVKVMPVKNDRQLIISFAMPSIDKYYRHKPESVLAYLIGHEGPGSILSLLKKQQWAMGISAGSGINGSNFKDFNVSISLTESGEQHLDEIVETVFSYITLLKQEQLPEHYYREKQAIAELSFTYHEKSSPLDNVCQLVLNMQHYPPEDYIFGDYVMDAMCHDTIKKLLGYLTPSNMRLVHISKNQQPSKTSYWYQVPYDIGPIAKNKLAKWQQMPVNKALFLPPANPYIVSNPQVIAPQNGSKIPTLVEKTDGFSLWFKQDITFKVPKGYIYIGIDSPFSVSSAENIAMTRLFVDLYTDDVIEENYDAELAGIHYHLYAHQGGMTLQVSGLSEKQGDLLAKLLVSLQHHVAPENRFELFKQQSISHWANADKSKSISQLFATMSSAMQPNNLSSQKLAEALSGVSYQQFLRFSEQLFTQVTIEALVHGNWLLEHTKQISACIKKTFHGYYREEYTVNCPVIDIKAQGQLILPVTLPDHDHASVLYYPQADKEVNTTAKTMITSHLLSPLFFQEMRTEKQYGYLVGVGYIPISRYPGIAFYIQSPHTMPGTLTEAMDDFIHTCLEKLEDLSEQDWQHLQHGLAGQLQENDASLRIKSQRFWGAISNKDTEFKHKQNLIDAILALTFDEVKTFIRTQLFKSAAPDRLLLVTTACKEELSFAELKQQLGGMVISREDELNETMARKY
ncbi:insulinase family protein [Thalassomonas haliotis]|uniref:Protease 3 n=1 Tax=Thalassomonas haliotis TaxID=485448 RepID=A0ABY7VJI4_9GAMM|nr:insulinase family protein [Thalassomonas haliotis]WDE13329.1 insulinase family protein [Thalassomonas haliotis]